MRRNINKVAVLGSGIMGSRIACHFANIGLDVLLLDIAPKDLSKEEEKKGLNLADEKVKNRIVTTSFQTTLKAKPAPLYHKSFASKIQLGNFDDDLAKIYQYDWIIEVIVENLEIKNQLYDKIEKLRKPGSLITSNTSGIPINLMSNGRTEDFQAHFCGTHFFNPPRYLKLLEIIPGPKTNPDIIDFLMHYGDLFLGKTTVLCKDTPAFIANRIGIYSILKVVQSMQRLGLNIDEIDKLTGPVIGRPKSATFRTSDIVGLDTLIKVADNLHEGLPDDEQREVFKLPDIIGELAKNNWLGDKTKQGFYKKTKDNNGLTKILTLDLKTLEYTPKQKAKFATLELTKSIDNVKDRFKVLLAGKDKAGEFYRDSFYGIFQYISNRIPEVTDELFKIDDALCAGFGWEVGPFDAWDQVGLAASLEKMEQAGYKPNQWVYDMVESGAKSFYNVEKGVRMYYDIPTKSYKEISGKGQFIILDNLRANKEIWKNSGASIFDLGDGILNLEFRTKMNTMGSEVIEGMNKVYELGESEYRGIVIGNQGANFSVGANLGMVFMYAIEQEYDELNILISTFQDIIMKARYSSVPVIIAPHGMSLGGGCELTLHADQVQAYAETYIGLVEFGVGLIPGGGGTKELTRRVSERTETGDIEYNALQNAFMNIATAKVATSAEEARDMLILRPQDRITINPHRQIAEAKMAAIELSEAGYSMPVQKKNIKVQGRGGLALFHAGITGMRMGNYISDHDKLIAMKLANIMCGGDLSAPTEVSEQYLLDLEREAFLSLCGERKTLERIQAILNGKKALRN